MLADNLTELAIQVAHYLAAAVSSKDSGLKQGNEVRHRKVVTRMGIHSLTEKSHY